MTAGRPRDDHGAVTVEAAIGIGSLVVVFGLILAAASVVLAQLRCTDAAVEAARLVARGDEARAAAAVRALAPAGASLHVASRGDQAIVTVDAKSFDVGIPVPELTARAVAIREPTGEIPEESPAPAGNSATDEVVR